MRVNEWREKSESSYESESLPCGVKLSYRPLINTLLLSTPHSSKRRLLLATSSLDICEGGLIPRRHKEGHIRQLSNWDA